MYVMHSFYICCPTRPATADGQPFLKAGMKIFLDVISDVSEGYRERFLETNKKINYIACQETARQIY